MLMSGNAAFLMILMRSDKAEVEPKDQQEPQ